MRLRYRQGLFVLTLAVIWLAGCASMQTSSVDRKKRDQGRNRTVMGQTTGSGDGSQLRRTTPEDTRKLKELDGRDHVSAKRKQKSLVITVDSKILFDLRSAEIKREAWPTLDEIAKYIVQKDDYWVLVQGHADTLPTRTKRYPSNWELSSMRAVNVVKYLSHMKGLNDARLIAAGFGEYHPVASNDTERGRRLNRRVEIHLIKDIFPDKEF